GGFAAAFFRRRLRRGSALALVVTGLCGIFLMPAAASATTMRKGDTIHISKGEKIVGDAYLTGHRCSVDGDVDGDLFVVCQSADVSGHVTGDVIGFAQSLRITGPIDGNVRTACNNLTLSGSLGKNLLAFGDSLRLDSDAKTGGSITTFGNTISVDGSVGR